MVGHRWFSLSFLLEQQEISVSFMPFPPPHAGYLVIGIGGVLGIIMTL